MSTKTWTREEIVAYAELFGLKLEHDDEINRMIALATRTAAVAASIKRMRSKGHEPANIFKVPL